ncbi:OmpA family protein [Shewanella marinintestina]|uniref:OmpA family protein n=1 Tax=Shewanella marinintestina TaxID=190305 RepID=UPI00200FEB36|nr:OmpA family protein [Shewanella marinintestina]MCL1145359.1 OmpA family protein [Shewanella marinintestina]
MTIKTSLYSGSIISVLWLLSGCAQEIPSESTKPNVQQQRQYELESYCANKGYNISYSVTIEDVTAIANHRDGYLMIQQETNHPDIKSALLTLANHQDISLTCMEYLSTTGLIKWDAKDELLARVYFDFDSNALTPESRFILDKVAKRLIQNSEVVKLVGHTDAVGTDEYNYSLGLRRANSTETYLYQQGMSNTQLESLSQGELKPIADNETGEGRGLNRRVELLVSPSTVE